MADTEDPWAKFDVNRQTPPKDEPVATAPAPDPSPWGQYGTGTERYVPPETPSGGATRLPPMSWQTAADFARTAGNSATYGQWDRARAVGEALTGGAPSYDEALRDKVGRSQAARERLGPLAAGTADAIGGITPAIGLVKGGITFAANQAPQLWRRIVAGGTEGAIHGAAQAAGHTYTGEPGDYVSNAGKGAGMGAVFGGAAPVVAKAVGGIYKAIADRPGAPGAIPGDLAKAAQTDPFALATMQSRLGDRAMLTEGNTAMGGLAQGAILGKTLPGQAHLENSLRARNETANQTILGAAERDFGPAPSPTFVHEAIGERMAGMSPDYRRVLSGARAIDTQGIDNRLTAALSTAAGPDQAALQYWRGQLEIPTNPGVLDPHPLRIQNVRTALRNQIRDPANAGTAGTLQHIDDILTAELQHRVPGIRELDHAYAELGSQQRGIEAASPGGRMFKTDQGTVIRPDEMQRYVTAGVQPKGVNVGPSAETFRMQQAARAELDRAMRTKPNDLLAFENVAQKPEDYNAQKMSVMWGPQRTNRMVDTAAAEREFRNSFQNIVQGSQTATRLASAKQTEGGSGISGDAIGRPLWGDIKAMGNAVINKWKDATSVTARDNIARIMATTDPQEVAALIPRILAAEPERKAREEVVRTLIQQGIIGGGSALSGAYAATPKKQELRR